ncbi:MAG TPA: DUF4142 domain-containing protein [Planctomycetota bacterium]|nr:DUF4142 domain-containing protein [Planctomycetota bacterium]
MLLRRLLLLLALVVPFAALQAADTVPLTKDDTEFANKATIGGLTEIQSAETALKRNLTAEEQSFAKELIADHKKANDELAAIAKAKNTTLPTGLNVKEQQKLAKIGEVKDKDFNAKFLEHQITCHKKAIDLFKDEADDGKDADLKAFAIKMLPHLKEHLETAKRLEAKY